MSGALERHTPAARRALTPLLLFALAVLLVAVPSLPSTCPVRWILHVPCPSCGLTRAARLALGGDFAAATRMHPLWFVVLPYVGFVGVGESIGFVRCAEWGSVLGRRWVKGLGALLVAALVVVWVARFLGAFGGPVEV
jgi:hypothetical protein